MKDFSPEVAIESGRLIRRGEDALDIGDLDQNRNLKIRTFVRLGLRPLFDDLEATLNFRAMVRSGVAPGQYYQDFESFPRARGYGRVFGTEHTVSLCRGVVDGREGPIERLIVETRARLSSPVVTGEAELVGFEPPLGDPALAGQSRVLHLLTRPAAPPGQRHVTEVPASLGFLDVHPFEGEFPTPAALDGVAPGFAPVADDAPEAAPGRWGIANSDVFQHVHAREYLFAMENRVGALVAAAGLDPARYAPTRARVIFRRPSLVGQRYALRCTLHRHDDTLVAIGSFHLESGDGFDDRPATLLRFEGQLL